MSSLRNEAQLGFDTIDDCDNFEGEFWLSANEFESEAEKENPIVNERCHLTGKIRRLGHNKGNSNIRKTIACCAPILYHNFSGHDCRKYYFRKYKLNGH